ncbi:MAG: hypothetical protein GY873_02990 [Bosea sp.]|nr:hypothetical protein [Bosea sp. (in: a-proteobacteria)]
MNIIIVVVIINRKENLRHTAPLDHYPLIRLTWVFQEQNQCEHHHRRRHHHQPQGKSFQEQNQQYLPVGSVFDRLRC